MDAKADDSTGEHGHGDQHPVTAQKHGFAAEQVDAPQTVLDVPDERQPREPVGCGVAWPVVLCEHTTNDVLVNLDAEGVRDLLGNPYTAESGISALHLDDRRDECCRRTFGAGFAATVAGGKESSIFPVHQGVAGLTTAPSFGIRRGLTNSAHTLRPSTRRSRVVRFGAMAAAIAGQKLVFDQKGFCGGVTYSTWAEQLCDGDQ